MPMPLTTWMQRAAATLQALTPHALLALGARLSISAIFFQ